MKEEDGTAREASTFPARLRAYGGRGACLLSLGFFAIVAQTLLFRSFQTALEGNELGIGAFFGSWLVWVALGGLAGRLDRPAVRSLARRFELALLLYLPAFLLQRGLITNARYIAGIKPYELFPFAKMFAVAMFANGPTGFLSGFFFTLACQWVSGDHALPVARVYILETIGACLGGAAVTLLLSGGVTEEAAFLFASFVVALSVAVELSTRKGPASSRLVRLAGLVPCLVVLVLLLAGCGRWWAERSNRAAWRRLLPAETYRGSFTTAQARYSYGERGDQFIVMAFGGVVEALPDTEHASEVVALTLAQNPLATNALVIGSGSLSICQRFLELPGIKHVSWLHTDPGYPKAVLGVLPERFRRTESRLDIPGMDVRDFAEGTEAKYDLVVLNIPDATTLVLNRYTTREFFAFLKPVLRERGVVAVRVSGAGNYLGGELIYLGSSVLTTLESVFANVVLKPGDESWLIASDADIVTESPTFLRDRFGAIKGASALYPPEGLLSLYLPDRIEFQKQKYRETAARVGSPILLNTNARPKALLYSLLLAVRRAGSRSFSRFLPVVLGRGPWIIACAVAFYGLLRLIYLLKSRFPGRSGGSGTRLHVFDGQFMIFSVGLAGMSLSITLMFLYQSRYGSLFLHVGLLTSLFMLGSFGGSFLCERVLVGFRDEPRALLPGIVLAQLFVVFLITLASGASSRVYYILLFALSGTVTGIVFPLAAHRMKASGRPVASSGSSLEMLDHIGGATGALATGLFMIPLWGGQGTLVLLSLVLAVNLLPLLVPPRTETPPAAADLFDRAKRPAGYVLFGAAAFALAASQIVVTFPQEVESHPLIPVARTLTGGSRFNVEHAKLDDGSDFTFLRDSDDTGIYVFTTEELVEGIEGYGGEIVLAVAVDKDGTLIDSQVLQSNETPMYLERAKPWMRSLRGRNLFESSSLAGVDTVSGATLTSTALLKTLEASGTAFASQVLGKKVEVAGPTAFRWLPDRNFLVLGLLMALAVAARFFAGVWARRGVLLGSFLVVGVFLNQQYSTQQVMSLAGCSLPAAGLDGQFFLVVVVPAAVMLFGNVYCGWVCPFGALQELVGDLRPQSLATEPDKRVWKYGRAMKYVLLALLVVLYAITRSFRVLSADPLFAVFSTIRGRVVTVTVAAVLVLSFFFRRFWCRNLCPAGAFLSLFNGINIFRRALPPARPAHCDLGVRTSSELDCIYCDRCRHEKT